MDLVTLLEAIKIITAVSIFFVWVVRYKNIIEEFKKYNLPDWLRDLTGILKLSFAAMILNKDPNLVIFGATGILALMIAAQFTHVKVKSRTQLRVPSFVLLGFSVLLIVNNM